MSGHEFSVFYKSYIEWGFMDKLMSYGKKKVEKLIVRVFEDHMDKIDEDMIVRFCLDDWLEVVELLRGNYGGKIDYFKLLVELLKTDWFELTKGEMYMLGIVPGGVIGPEFYYMLMNEKDNERVRMWLGEK